MSGKDPNSSGPQECASGDSGWEAVRRRELWAWAWLTVCILWLVYNLVFLSRGRWWEVSISACFVALSAREVLRARKSRKKGKDDRSPE